jgi:hypothetical protein
MGAARRVSRAVLFPLLAGCGGITLANPTTTHGSSTTSTTSSANGSTTTSATPTAASAATSIAASSSASSSEEDAGDAVTRCDNLEQDFWTTSANPNGVWSYGWSPTLGSAFNLYTVFSAAETDVAAGAASMVGWSTVGANPTPPLVDVNPNRVAVHAGVSASAPDGTTIIPPGATDIHPGPQGQYSIARWTAPRSGTFTIEFSFYGESGYGGCSPTTTDVHVQHNGADIASGLLNLDGAGNGYAASPMVVVAAGDTIDFAVGYGNGSYVCDSTEVGALVCPAP